MSKILIIDDDKDVLFAAEQYLQKNNEDVFTATGGSQGLRVLKQETIDCIVLDVLLKGESGFDLCRKIRSFSSVPIVFLTNLSSQEDLKNGLDTCKAGRPRRNRCGAAAEIGVHIGNGF